MSIPDRVSKAIRDLSLGEYDNALIQVCIAIDATAKKEFPAERDSPKRCKEFIKNNETFLMAVASKGKLQFYGAVEVRIESPLAGPTVADWLYGIVRSGLLHEADISGKVEFTDDLIIGMVNGKYAVSSGLIMGLILAVMGSPANKDERVNENIGLNFNGVFTDITEMWGNLDAFRKLFDPS